MGKILIISCNALGDTYLSASALEPLRNFDPSLEIHFIAPISSNFFLKNLVIDKIYFLVNKKVINILKLLKDIRKNEFDIVFDFFPGLINSIFFYFSNSPIKIGFPNFIKRNQWYNNSQKAVIKGFKNKKFVWRPNMNFLLRISKLLELAEIKTENVAKPIFNNLKQSASNSVDGITIHYKARNNEKSISNNDVIRLCTSLLKRDIKRITLVGTELDFNSYIIQFCKKNSITIIINPSLKELLNLIIGVRVFIGVDSFPLHIADAYNSNFLGVFGPTFPSSVLVNSGKSIRFRFSNYINIDTHILCERIAEIFEKV